MGGSSNEQQLHIKMHLYQIMYHLSDNWQSALGKKGSLFLNVSKIAGIKKCFILCFKPDNTDIFVHFLEEGYLK